MPEEVDAIVIGLGVGGEEVAGQLAQAGLRVVGIEGNLVGGECPYWGCIPSKMAVRAADLLAETSRVADMAGDANATADWGMVAERIRVEATTSWNDQAAVDRFTGKGGRFIRGWARLLGPGLVEVAGQTFQARKAVVLGAGASPVIPPIDGLADTPYWTNRQLLEAETLPDSLAVLGGGAIGLELAQALSRFGVNVDIIESMDRLLPSEEPESSDLMAETLAGEGINLHLDSTVDKVAYTDSFTLGLEDGRKITADNLLVSIGRRPNVASLGVSSVGLDAKAPAVLVDDRMRAGHQLWAVGDITGRGAFTHVAMYQARIAVRDILGQGGPVADYRALPRVTFTDPEIGAVGMTEIQARRDGIHVATGKAQLPSTARGWIHKAGNAGFIKLVADADRDILVGATSAGPMGGEVLSALTLGIHAQVQIPTLRHMIYAYPTFHRGIEDALADLAEASTV